MTIPLSEASSTDGGAGAYKINLKNGKFIHVIAITTSYACAVRICSMINMLLTIRSLKPKRYLRRGYFELLGYPTFGETIVHIKF